MLHLVLRRVESGSQIAPNLSAQSEVNLLQRFKGRYQDGRVHFECSVQKVCEECKNIRLFHTHLLKIILYNNKIHENSTKINENSTLAQKKYVLK